MIHRKVLLLLFLIGLSILGLARFDARANQTIIKVPLDYPTIQEAIDHANPGDTVSVSAGTYYENLYINKNLTLTGENAETTIINGVGGWYGIEVNSSSVTITGFTIVNATLGIYLYKSTGCIVSHNNITTSHIRVGQDEGIWLYASNDSVAISNIVHDVGWRGIVLCGYSSEDSVTLNTVKDCGTGIAVSGKDNFICHNNFVNNQNQTEILDPPHYYNIWNNTNEGNYWSDYKGADANQDGIGNTPYIIGANNTDYHPLMGMYLQFEIASQAQTYTVTTICNSTITNFAYGTPSAGEISFNTTGSDGTNGFCRIVIPTALFAPDCPILVDGSPPLTRNNLPLSNSTYTYIYFTFANTTHKIIVVPEFPTTLALLIIALVIPATLAITKRRLKPEHSGAKPRPPQN